ncbi:efflux transporter outer membrane subunit [Achromobacter insolitus]|uniref:efflux transporter outer membrane subunit n=1 Tax=Achromobacter insolitus TaxID=217204 RepID=UPI0015835F27|nr:efflux transporter outer membrane subunit [Achromobacter insolitus]
MIRFPIARTSIVLLGLVVTGCAVGPTFHPPSDQPSAASMQPRDGQSLSYALRPQPVPIAWWDLLADPILTGLQRRAAQTNLDLQVAAARLAQSRAQLGIANARSMPRLGSSASYAREADSANGKMVALGAPTDTYEYWQAGFDASWEIDLWGHARKQREQAGAEATAAWYDQEAVRVAMAAEIARNYVLLRGTQARLDIAAQNEKIAAHALRLAESRARNGVATHFDTAAASAQLATVRALQPELAMERDAYMNALALLLGQPPRDLDAELGPVQQLPRPPQAVPVGLPSELARRRPDIQRAQARLQAATAAVGVATADFYPRLTLGGRLGVEAFHGGDLGNWASRQFSVGPTLYLPIFEGGRLRSTLALTEARQQEAAIAFQQTVLRAWHEVDDALNAWAAVQRRHAELQHAFDHNRLALQASERAYQQGVADYLPVLIAQRNLLDSQLALTNGSTRSTLTVVTLYKALGGGWDPAAVLGHLPGGEARK